MKIVLLSGGSGQRLWPLSNDACSKQYISFINHDSEALAMLRESSMCEQDGVNGANVGVSPAAVHKVDISVVPGKCSMLQRVYEQLLAVGMGGNVVVAASEAQRELVESQLGSDAVFSSEPLRRDTFPAVLLASAFVHSKLGTELDEVVAFIPVDPYVNLDYFRTLVKLGEEVAGHKDDVIGLMGAAPTYPSEKYGYIIADEKTNSTAVGDINSENTNRAASDSTDGDFSNVIRVAGFAEKPDLERAKELLAAGALWNCGVFCFKLSTAKTWADKYELPFDYDVISKESNYQKLPKKSFDYEVLEHADNIIALAYKGMWKDIGTWNTLTEEMSEDSLGKVVIDETTKGCNVINTLDVPVILMGGQNLVVAATSDGILVADKEQSSFLKQSLSRIDATPRYEERRWGTVKTIERSVEDGCGVCTNMVRVKEGQYTTYHRHMLHDEIITVVSGEGYIILNGTKIMLSPGTSFTINRGALHAIKATTKLKYVEVLMGEIGKDDIERISFELPD